MDVLRRTVTALDQALPSAWSINATTEVKVGDRTADALIEVTGPGETTVVLIVEVRSSLVTRDLPSALARAQASAAGFPGPAVPMLVGRHLSLAARTWLDEHDASYADATGNVRIAINRPALFIRAQGAAHDPWRGPGRPRGSLRGPAAARILRALVDFAPPVSVPELARRAGASTGSTYRVAELLEEETLIERTLRGPIHTVRWRNLIRRWSKDYGFQQSNSIRPCLHPRGLDAVIQCLSSAEKLRYAITGSLTAQRFAPHAPPRLAMVYVDDPDRAQKLLELRSVDSGANVLLATGDYDVVYDRLDNDGGLRFVSPSQAAVDLLTAPGRSPAEAETLLDWMESHEPEWRR
jgi:hypothetical protein